MQSFLKRLASNDSVLAHLSKLQDKLGMMYREYGSLKFRCTFSMQSICFRV